MLLLIMYYENSPWHFSYKTILKSFLSYFSTVLKHVLCVDVDGKLILIACYKNGYVTGCPSFGYINISSRLLNGCQSDTNFGVEFLIEK